MATPFPGPRTALAVLAAAVLLAAPAEAAKVTTERIPVPDAEQAAPPGLTIQFRDMQPDASSDDSAQPVPEEKTTPDEETSTAPLPEIHYGTADLPKPVMRLREQILEAARSGDLERLRPVLESNEMPPTLSLTQIDDPIDFLKQASGDPNGREVLAILSEILEAGWVHVDVGTPQEMYIWPYFARYPLARLTPPQEVELYRILTAADVEEMQDFGAYIFYRVGIGPDGTWHYFVAGD